MNNQQEKLFISNDDIKLDSDSQSSSDNEGSKNFGTCEECQQPNTGHKWAIWTEGHIKWWDHEKKKWQRNGEISIDRCDLACLKSLKHFTKEFFQEIKNQLKFRKNGKAIAVYGITKDPEKDGFVMVMQYAEKGSLRSMLYKTYNELSWINKLEILRFIAIGLSRIHKEGLVHKDFHSGNIMMTGKSASHITDFGLCKPITTDSTKVFTGYPPFHDAPHDIHLVHSIYNGLRPKIRRPIPKLLEDLIERCLDENLEKRPSSKKLRKILNRYYDDVNLEIEESEIYRQVKSIEEDSARLQKDYSIDFSQLKLNTHTTAVYTSQLLPNPDLFSGDSSQHEIHI
ncbi:10446_t:CDS:2 [Acaulospora morrowiae]|uniref:10446_t:CDS:1 n=1 Tax=Acaulospora morrowiae TaxID=94023 RepID=A0A9N9DLE4_9GLOM|nr:10446_t:CDS:2 [Acaulospora morrowiae]